MERQDEKEDVPINKAKQQVNENKAHLIGKIISTNIVWKTQEHISYESYIQIVRDSGVIDILPVLYNDRQDIEPNSFVEINGQFRSRDIIDQSTDKLRVELYIYAKDINIIDDTDKQVYKDDILLTGYICKKPTLRTTPSGKQLSDLLIACNFGKDRTAYIPAITWGKYARKSGKLQVGSLVKVNGRLQSRKYSKTITNKDGISESIEKVAYELSVSSIDEFTNKTV